MAGWKYARAFQVAFGLSLVGVTWLSLEPSLGSFLPGGDKLGHTAGYFALGLLADFAFPRRGFAVPKALPLILYGAALEVLQWQIPGRFAEVSDVAANTAGLALFWMCLPLLKRFPILRSRWSA